jgi:hypothetical protein
MPEVGIEEDLFFELGNEEAARSWNRRRSSL